MGQLVSVHGSRHSGNNGSYNREGKTSLATMEQQKMAGRKLMVCVLEQQQWRIQMLSEKNTRKVGMICAQQLYQQHWL